MLALLVVSLSLLTGCAPVFERGGDVDQRSDTEVEGPGTSALAGSTGPLGADHAHLTGPYKLDRIVDGDTLIAVVDGVRTRVRLIGIDTPESKRPDHPVECFGPEASERITQILRDEEIWLEHDPSQGRTDKFDRTLAYVWSDGALVNEQMVREGFGVEFTFAAPYRYQDRFREAEDRAADEGAGLWSACDDARG